MKLVILATVGTFDIELHYDAEYGFENPNQIATIIADLMDNTPEVKPRAKYQPKAEFTPGTGTVKSTRMGKTKSGKDICFALVTLDAGGEIECSYLPPQKTWRAEERANVVKGQYGPELKEIEDGNVTPF